MLVALNHAFDGESISNLLFLYHVDKEIRKRASEIMEAGQRRKKLIIDDEGTIQMHYKDAPKDLNLLVFSGDGVLKFSHLILTVRLNLDALRRI